MPRWEQFLLGANAFVLLLLWAFTIWRFYLSPDFIPLHYTVYFGFDRFGPKSDLFLFPVLGTVVALANFASVFTVFRASSVWRKFFLVLNLLLEALLLVALILVVLKRLS